MNAWRSKPAGCIALGALVAGGMLSSLLVWSHARSGGARQAYERGRGLEAVQMAVEAEAAYQEAIRLDPHYAPPYRVLAEHAVTRGDNNEAIAYWKAYVQYAPHAEHAWCRLAQAEALLGLEKPAVNDAEQELRVAPDCPRAHLALGVLYAKQNNAQLALQHLTVAAKAYPNDPQVQLVYGKVLALSGQFDPAEIVLKSILAKDTSHAQPYYLLGYVYARRRSTQADRKEALNYLHHALLLEPEDADANFELGRLYFNQGQPREALPYLRTSVTRKRHFVAALYTLAQVQSALGQTSEAHRTQTEFRVESDHAAQEKALLSKYVIAPTDLETQIALGLLELERAEPTAALMFLQSAARQSPQDARVQDALHRADQMRAAQQGNSNLR